MEYRHAAEAIHSDSNADEDRIIKPFCLCAALSIELMLKGLLIHKGRGFEDLDKNHDLKKLAESFPDLSEENLLLRIYPTNTVIQ